MFNFQGYWSYYELDPNIVACIYRMWLWRVYCRFLKSGLEPIKYEYENFLMMGHLNPHLSENWFVCLRALRFNGNSFKLSLTSSSPGGGNCFSLPRSFFLHPRGVFWVISVNKSWVVFTSDCRTIKIKTDFDLNLTRFKIFHLISTSLGHFSSCAWDPSSSGLKRLNAIHFCLDKPLFISLVFVPRLLRAEDLCLKLATDPS